MGCGPCGCGAHVAGGAQWCVGCFESGQRRARLVEPLGCRPARPGPSAPHSPWGAATEPAAVGEHHKPCLWSRDRRGHSAPLRTRSPSARLRSAALDNPAPGAGGRLHAARWLDFVRGRQWAARLGRTRARPATLGRGCHGAVTGRRPGECLLPAQGGGVSRSACGRHRSSRVFCGACYGIRCGV